MRLNRGAQVYNSKTGELARIIWIGPSPGNRAPLMIEVINIHDGNFDLWPNTSVELV